MNTCLAIALCLHTLVSLASTGWYTPQAQRELFTFPVTYGATGTNVAARTTSTAIIFRNGFFDETTWFAYMPLHAREVMMHEFNHHFDFLCSDFQCFSNDPEFLALSANLVSPDRRFPFSTNPVERYAAIGQTPWFFPQLRRFYPQFSDAAYLRP